MATGNMAECFGTVIFEGVRAIGVLSYRTIKRHFGEHPVENLLRFFANKKMRIEIYDLLTPDSRSSSLVDTPAFFLASISSF